MLIDEFQDTDPVQAELALLLTSDQEPDGDWRDASPGARPADRRRRPQAVDLPLPPRRHRRLRPGARAARCAGAHEQISTNFRSNPQLLAALNAVFDTVLERQPGVQPGNVALDAPPDAPSAKRPPIVLALGELDPKTKADELRREEARTIAALLHTAHQRAVGDPRPPRRRIDGGRAGGATWRS